MLVVGHVVRPAKLGSDHLPPWPLLGQGCRMNLNKISEPRARCQKRQATTRHFLSSSGMCVCGCNLTRQSYRQNLQLNAHALETSKVCQCNFAEPMALACSHAAFSRQLTNPMASVGLQAHFDCKYDSTMASSSLVATTLSAVNLHVAKAMWIARMYIANTTYCCWLDVCITVFIQCQANAQQT